MVTPRANKKAPKKKKKLTKRKRMRMVRTAFLTARSGYPQGYRGVKPGMTEEEYAAWVDNELAEAERQSEYEYKKERRRQAQDRLLLAVIRAGTMYMEQSGSMEKLENKMREALGFSTEELGVRFLKVLGIQLPGMPTTTES